MSESKFKVGDKVVITDGCPSDVIANRYKNGDIGSVSRVYDFSSDADFSDNIYKVKFDNNEYQVYEDECELCFDVPSNEQNNIAVIALLNMGLVRIEFKKKDGSLRKMVGTRNMKSIPKEHHPKGTGYSSPKVVTVFDVTENEWRCFKPENLISAKIVAISKAD